MMGTWLIVTPPAPGTPGMLRVAVVLDEASLDFDTRADEVVADHAAGGPTEVGGDVGVNSAQDTGRGDGGGVCCWYSASS